MFYYIPPAISLPHRISVYAWRRSTSRIPLRIRIFLPACSCRGKNISTEVFTHSKDNLSCCPHADILCLRMDSKNFFATNLFLFIYLFYICDKQKSNNMKTSIVTFLITFCFYLSAYAQASQDKAAELKEQALSRKITSKPVICSRKRTRHLLHAKTIHRL